MEPNNRCDSPPYQFISLATLLTEGCTGQLFEIGQGAAEIVRHNFNGQVVGVLVESPECDMIAGALEWAIPPDGTTIVVDEESPHAMEAFGAAVTLEMCSLVKSQRIQPITQAVRDHIHAFGQWMQICRVSPHTQQPSFAALGAGIDTFPEKVQAMRDYLEYCDRHDFP